MDYGEMKKKNDYCTYNYLIGLDFVYMQSVFLSWFCYICHYNNYLLFLFRMKATACYPFLFMTNKQKYMRVFTLDRNNDK